MPIYDNDGTANREIGKLYDYNGSANTQIGKVYDNNGTTNSLIYNYQSPTTQVIFNGTNQVSAITGGWSMPITYYRYFSEIINNGQGVEYKLGTQTGIAMSYSGNNPTGRGVAQTNSKIAISGWTYLNLDYYWQGGFGAAAEGPGYIYIGLSSTKLTDWSDNNRNWEPTWVKVNSVWRNNSSGTGTLSCNISDIDGSYYVAGYRKNGDGSKTFTTVFKKIYFS